MGNKYNHLESDLKWQEYREENQIYRFDPASSKPTYSIDTPPPTVSGKLHLGHIFSYSHAELIARYKRMDGYNVFYPMGYDDNGIPTEQLVEKELGINIKDIERKDFVNKCLEINQKYRDIYKKLWQSLGISVDRSRTYATISLEVQHLVQQTFIKLYKQGDIVAKDFPALRCTKMQTTLAQAETEEKEFSEFFNDIKFTLDDGGDLVIATTRPELLPACLAVFVHPDDSRYVKYIGRKISTPLGVVVPLLADDKVKIDKGTGVVMCCSYGDETDVYWIQKHKLVPKIILDRYGKLRETGIPEIDGLKVNEAREKIMELLDAKGVVVRRTPITQSKMISERGQVPVEILPVHQWFVNLLDKKDILLQQNNKMNRYPTFMKKRSDDWIENLQRDWNISRSRTFGIPIPIWYDVKTHEVILPSEKQLAAGPVDPTVDFPEGYDATMVTGEKLVLDTRFTSGLTPQINQTFLKKSDCDKIILPVDLRPQAHDIIRTWLLYTTLHQYLHDGNVPFKNIMISGFVLAGKGEKFSKSKGNAKFDPEQLIALRGADAIRYWALGGQLGKDMLFEETEMKIGQKLVTKLWNAFQFVKIQLADADMEFFKTSNPEISLYPTDQRILIRLNETILEMRKYLDEYEYGLAKIKFEEFFWRDFCDMYLEMIKMRLYQPERYEQGEQKKLSGQYTLYQVFSTIIKLIAPYMPHVTEEIYQDYFKAIEGAISLHSTAYPIEIKSSGVPMEHKEKIKQDFAKIFELVETVRKYKTEKNISLGAELQKLVISGPIEYLDTVKYYLDDLSGVTKAITIEFLEKDGIAMLIEA